MRTVGRESYPNWIGAIARGLLKALGWRMLGERANVSKCVLVCAPHASNWDFFFFLLGTFCYQMPAMFTMKDAWFFWPLSSLWRWLGGIPIDRSKHTNVVDGLAATFAEHDVLRLALQPEGTRKDVEFWKTGFYWIAKSANVPILLTHLDYKNKEMAISFLVHPTEDVEADLAKVATYYEEAVGMTPKFRL